MSTASPRVAPPAWVLAAFGLDGPTVALAGGQGTAWRVGETEAVVKPLDMTAASLAWQHDLLPRLDGRDDFRVSVPLVANDGSLVVDGWTAWRFEPGDHRASRWAEVAAVGRRFHAAVAGDPEPGFLRSRSDRWAIGDKVAWGELPAERWADVSPLDALIAALEPVAAPSQLIHGDLTGNVLFHDGLPPLVIDLSPYWRPPVFATAIVAADALVFKGAGADLVETLLHEENFAQCLLRALIYRAVTDTLAADRGRGSANYDGHRPVADLALQVLRAA